MLVVVFVCCVAISCRRNAYYNFTEYARYTQHATGQRTWRHEYISSALEAPLDRHDTTFSVNFIDNATVSVGEMILRLKSNTDSTLIFSSEAPDQGNGTLVFNFVNSAIVFRRAAQDPNSNNWYSFDVFTGY